MKLFFGIIFASLSVGFAQQAIPSAICDEKPINYYVRNITDCAGWIQCTKDGTVSGVCPPSYHFYETLQICTQPEKANCFQCPPTGIVFEAVKNTCNRFVRCIFGVATEWYCEDGKQYNEAEKSCEDKTVVQCEEPCPSYLKAGEFTAKHDSTNCSTGLVCYGEPEAHRIYCNEKLHFDNVTLMCIMPEKSTCISKVMDDEGNCLTFPEPGEFIAKHDSTNCSIGYVCYGEVKAHPIHCNEKLHFDSTSLTCVQPEMSDCILEQTTVVTTSPTPSPINTPPTNIIEADATAITAETNQSEQTDPTDATYP